MRKRILCILLLLPTLIVSTFAVTCGLTNTKGGVSGGDSDWASSWSTGLALGIQTMKDAKYTVSEKTEKNTGTQYAEGIEFIEGVEINNKELANVCSHFLYSYPNPDTSRADIASTVFILPKRNAEPKYLTTNANGELQRVDIGDHYYAYQWGTATSNRPIYQDWDPYDEKSDVHKLYVDATSAAGIKDANYFKGYIAKMDHDTARDLIGYIFTPSQYKVISGNHVQQVDVAKVIERWNEVYEWNTNNDALTAEEKSIQKVCNYASILISLARILPSENWSMYRDNITQFVIGALNGKSYSPVVITAEMCMSYRYQSGGWYNAWISVPELLALWSNSAESAIRKADSDPLYVNSLNGYENMAVAILKTARAKSKGNKSDFSYGLKSMLGIDQYGNDATSYSANYCRAMTSLSKSAIQCLREKWKGAGISVPHDENTPALWGCGIFGGTEALTVATQSAEEWTAEVTEAEWNKREKR